MGLSLNNPYCVSIFCFIPGGIEGFTEFVKQADARSPDITCVMGRGGGKTVEFFITDVFYS